MLNRLINNINICNLNKQQMFEKYHKPFVDMQKYGSDTNYNR